MIFRESGAWWRSGVVWLSVAAALGCAGAVFAQHAKDKPAKGPTLDSFYIVAQSVAPEEDDASSTSATPVSAVTGNAAPANSSANAAASSGAAPASEPPAAPATSPQIAASDSSSNFTAGMPWLDTIIDVHRANDAIQVLKIEITPGVGPRCPPHAVVARAVQRVITADSVQQIAGHHHLCSMNESDVNGVIQAAAKDDVARENSTDLGSQTIVANCGGTERMLELPYPDTLRFHALGLADSRIAALWKMAAEVSARAFGSDFSFAAAPPADQAVQQKLAESLVPDIRNGKYASGFGDSNCPFASCRDHSAMSALQGYQGVLDPAACAPARSQ